MSSGGSGYGEKYLIENQDDARFAEREKGTNHVLIRYSPNLTSSKFLTLVMAACSLSGVEGALGEGSARLDSSPSLTSSSISCEGLELR